MEPGQYYESAEAKRRMRNLLDACGLLELLVTDARDGGVIRRAATRRELEAVHAPAYVERVAAASAKGGGDAGDCAFYGPGSFAIAALAAGCAIEAVDAVAEGRVDNAYVLCRPPGHHATREMGMGFCVFNSVAVAAKHARTRLRMERVAVVDYDVHHGNGTEEAFYGDPGVLVVSVHEDSLYPLGTGKVEDRGEGAGEGYNVNVPLPPGSGVGAYTEAFDRIVHPLLDAFEPEIILVSSGFDASALDPLGHMMLPSGWFGEAAARLAARGVGVVFVHEGGYSEVAAPFCGLRVLEAMAGVPKSNVVDVMEGEIRAYGYQETQAHQRAVIDRVEREIEEVKGLMRSRAAA